MMAARPRTSRRRRRLGQHFLTDARVAQRQVEFAELSPNDVVLEIGPGLGVLTRRIAPLVRRVIALELDPAMLAQLERLGLDPDRVRLVQADAARFDYTTLGAFNKVVANLPYSASSPITFRILPLPFETAVLMYQREFARRMVAAPGSDDYGRLAAACAYFVEARILEVVPPTAFTPPPAVESAIVRLVRHAHPPFPVGDPKTYLDLLRVLFSTRRKTIRATLRRRPQLVGLTDGAVLEEVLARTGVAERRPEELAPAALGQLDAALERVRRG